MQGPNYCSFLFYLPFLCAASWVLFLFSNIESKKKYFLLLRSSRSCQPIVNSVVRVTQYLLSQNIIRKQPARLKTQLAWLLTAVSDLLVLGWSKVILISNKLSSDANAADQEQCISVKLFQWVRILCYNIFWGKGSRRDSSYYMSVSFTGEKKKTI